MKKWLLLSLVLVLGLKPAMAQDLTVKVIKWPELQAYLESPSDKVRVVNFWATWCRPCVAELPHFQQVAQELEGQKVEFLLVSLDDVESLDSRVVPFVNRKGLTAANHTLLDETDYNSFIGLVDDQWSGAIPMTLILGPTGAGRTFLEEELTHDELLEEINQYLE